MKNNESIEKYCFEYGVNSFIDYNDSIIVLFDAMKFPKNKQPKNLQCFNKKMELLWVAEHPTNQTNDFYTSISIINEKNLKSFNFTGYNCIIDIRNGKLLEYTFTK